jgi:spore germination protein KB
MYTELQNAFPEKNLAQIILSLIGKTLGTPLVLLYAGYFFYISIQNFTEFGYLIGMTSLQNTPYIIILIIFILTVQYLLFLGIEVIARTSQIMLPIVLIFIFSVFGFIAFSENISFSPLTPVLANGIAPIVKAVYPVLLNFPFGEMVLFLMYWRYINIQEHIRKTSFLAVIASGLIIMITSIMIISTLGVETASSRAIPLLEVIQLINIAGIITNLDVIGVVIMFIGGFYKMMLFFYGGILSISTVFNLNTKKTNWIIVISSIIFLFVSLDLIKSFTFHRFLGKYINSPHIHNPFQFYIPILLLLIYWLKKALRNHA